MIKPARPRAAGYAVDVISMSDDGSSEFAFNHCTGS